MFECGADRINATLLAALAGAVALFIAYGIHWLFFAGEGWGPDLGAAAVIGCFMLSLLAIAVAVCASFLRYLFHPIVLRIDHHGLFFPLAFDQPVPWPKVRDVYCSYTEARPRAAGFEFSAFWVDFDADIKYRFWFLFRISTLRVYFGLLGAKEEDIKQAFAKYRPEGIRIRL